MHTCTCSGGRGRKVGIADHLPKAVRRSIGILHLFSHFSRHQVISRLSTCISDLSKRLPSIRSHDGKEEMSPQRR